MSETSAQGIYNIITAADSLGDAPGPLLVVPSTKNSLFFSNISAVLKYYCTGTMHKYNFVQYSVGMPKDWADVSVVPEFYW